MWHILIGGYKLKGLHQVFREFNFFSFFLNLIEASLKPYFCKPTQLYVHNFSKALEVAKLRAFERTIYAFSRLS